MAFAHPHGAHLLSGYRHGDGGRLPPHNTHHGAPPRGRHSVVSGHPRTHDPPSHRSLRVTVRTIPSPRWLWLWLPCQVPGACQPASQPAAHVLLPPPRCLPADGRSVGLSPAQHHGAHLLVRGRPASQACWPASARHAMGQASLLRCIMNSRCHHCTLRVPGLQGDLRPACLPACLHACRYPHCPWSPTSSLADWLALLDRGTEREMLGDAGRCCPGRGGAHEAARRGAVRRTSAWLASRPCSIEEDPYRQVTSLCACMQVCMCITQ
jgi:hypothetical protein